MKKLLLILMLIGVAVLSSCGNKANTRINTLTPSIINTDTNTPTTDTTPGDIVLYTSNQIVLFYGTNTSICYINLTKDELTYLLTNEDITI